MSLIQEGEWENFPKSFRWKECLKLMKIKCKEKSLYNNIRKTLGILIIDGNAVEDEVLLVAILKISLEHNILTIEEIKEKYEENIIKALQILIQEKDETFEEYVRRIFELNDYKYLRKIIVADIICELEEPIEYQSKSDIEYRAKIMLNYKGKTNRILMEKLQMKID